MMSEKIQRVILLVLAAVLALIIALRALGSEIVAKVIFTFIIYAATFAAAWNMKEARK